MYGHLHFHCGGVGGVIDTDACGEVVFHEARGIDASAITAVQATVRRRWLRVAQRRGLLSEDDAQTMADWAHGGGFSVDVEVRIEANDRDGLERLLRYCARLAFALERPEAFLPEAVQATKLPLARPQARYSRLSTGYKSIGSSIPQLTPVQWPLDIRRIWH